MLNDWDQRQLCPNGACVGVIGPDGTCKTCGHVAPNWGDERNRGLTPIPAEAPAGDGDDDDEYEDDDDDDNDDAGDEQGDVNVDPLLLADVEDSAWRTRKLCPDGACVGVIGDDGLCKACGKTGV